MTAVLRQNCQTPVLRFERQFDSSRTRWGVTAVSQVSIPAQLAVMTDQIRALGADDVHSWSPEFRAECLAGLQGLVDAAHAQMLPVVAASDVAGDGELLVGARSTAAWLKHSLRWSGRDATSTVRAARGYRDGLLADSAEELTQGRMSLQHVREVSRALSALPAPSQGPAAKILTDAAAWGNAAGRVLNWRSNEVPGWAYYPGSGWGNMLWQGGANFETPPPMLTREGLFQPLPPTGARTLDSRTAFYYGYTLDSPGMIMRVPKVGSQYLMGFVDADKNYLDGGKTYNVTLPPNIPAAAFWSLILYDNQTRSLLQTPQRYPRAGSQSYPSPAAEANADGSTVVYFGPTQPAGVKRGNWIQTMPGKGWWAILRLYSPLEPFFTKEWRLSEIELVK